MSAQGTTRQSRVTAILLVLILLLAAGLRFYGLDAQSLWNDEGTSLALAQRDLAAIARDAARDIHPPLYYWLLSGWVQVLGTSEAAVRSLSAALGIALVALTFFLGQLLAGRWPAVAAALLAAINPFQVYYSQEARMYMLVAVLAAGSILALLHYVRDRSWPALLVLILLEAAGLYTHYSFVFVALILNLVYVLRLRPGRVTPQVWPWAMSQLAVVLLYLPWLPTAVRQVTTWPSPAQTGGLLPALANTWRWVLLGPTIETSQVAIPVVLTGILAIVGALFLWLGWVGRPRLDSRWGAVLISLWVVLPIALMFALGLYREAYLKFLLVTTPAVSLLLSCGLLGSPQTTSRPAEYRMRNTPHASRFTPHVSRLTRYAYRGVQLIAGLAILLPTAAALQNYYADPAYARDNYRSITAYIEAVGQPGDAIVLNAPGQQEVFGYYYDGRLPVYPLPGDRPLDPATTERTLA